MARLLCERGRLGPQKLLVPRNRWWVVSWPWRCPLLHELMKECRLLIAPSQHGRNGLSQIRRVRWFPHSAFSHGWISPIILITKQSTMEERRKRKLNQKARNLFFCNQIRTIRILIRNIRTPHPDYPDLCPEYPDTSKGRKFCIAPTRISGLSSGMSGHHTRTIRTYVRSIRIHPWCFNLFPPPRCMNF